MRSNVRLSFVVATLISFAGVEARAQFGYGYYPAGYGAYGWGGWGGGGGTVQGDIARGLGYFAMGEGVYNRETAIANAIDTDTALRWNEYWYDAQVVANRNERIRLDRRMRRDASAGEAEAKRVRENPTPEDIASGNALNSALDQISNPRIHSSALRLANDRIPGKVVRQIPFVNASEAVTLSLDRLTTEDGWPAALRDPAFSAERTAYTRAVDQALEEDREGDIKPETLARLRSSLSTFRSKFEANRPTDPGRYGESESYLKSLVAMTRLLERPDIEKIVAELETTKETTLGNLLGFMHSFNLRFGRATSPAQRAVYESLYPLLDAHRDRIVKETKDSDSASARTDNAPSHPSDFFKGMHLDRLDGKTRDR